MVVAGDVRGVGVEFLGELVECSGDAGLVAPVDGDGDGGADVGNGAGLVEKVAGDGADLVGVGEVGVEASDSHSSAL